MCILLFVFPGLSFVAFSFIGWVFSPVKTHLPYNLYCVDGDVKHY